MHYFKLVYCYGLNLNNALKNKGYLIKPKLSKFPSIRMFLHTYSRESDLPNFKYFYVTLAYL